VRFDSARSILVNHDKLDRFVADSEEEAARWRRRLLVSAAERTRIICTDDPRWLWTDATLSPGSRYRGGGGWSTRYGRRRSAKSAWMENWSGRRLECAGQGCVYIPRMKGLREWGENRLLKLTLNASSRPPCRPLRTVERRRVTSETVLRRQRPDRFPRFRSDLDPVPLGDVPDTPGRE
jgi:hypothetical protein